MKQKIVGFHLDEENDWVADLACGHKQHVRHDPPFFKREWVTKPETRKEYLGTVLNCKRCDKIASCVSDAIKNAVISNLQIAQADAAAAAMCTDGQIDLILDRLKNLDFENISKIAISEFIKNDQ